MVACIPALRVNNIYMENLACMIDAYAWELHMQMLKLLQHFIAITHGKPCFKSIKAIIGAYVVTPFKII